MHHEGTQAGTINPLLLERSTNHNNVLTRPKQFDNSLGTRLANVARDTDNRKHSGAVDVLRRAKELGIKIWHLDKFNRILAVIFDENHPPHGQLTRNTMSNMPQASRTLKHTDLSQMIKNEQLHGPADRESMLTTDLIMLKGPHIYVRCMNEKHKPIMVRDYPRVQNREDAEWPQFRSASMGKCPFIEDDNVQRRTVDKGKPKGASRIARTKDAGQLAPPPRSMTSKALQMQPPQQAGRKRTFEETDLSVSAATQPLQQQLPPPAVVHPISSKQGDATAMPVPLFGGEPMASGMQASNITSAIRSQMISSTAAAPGAKAGTSKEIHGLQRKVLERNSGPTLVELTSNNRVRSVSVAANSNVRLAKQRAQEKLGHRLIDIHENATLSEQDETDQKTQNVGKRNALKSKKSKRDCKPGYCENCKEKFSDFEEVRFLS